MIQAKGMVSFLESVDEKLKAAQPVLDYYEQVMMMLVMMLPPLYARHPLTYHLTPLPLSPSFTSPVCTHSPLHNNNGSIITMTITMAITNSWNSISRRNTVLV